jgi:carbonic anhydrase
MDDDYITQATVSVSNEGLILENASGLGSLKFRGESYICQAISINHPSHHTIEGVQADGEVTGIFRKPTGEIMCMSSLFRVNPAQTPSYTFFKQFVPYALTTGDTKVTLQNWSVSMMVPPTSAYYVYSGSTLVPPCAPCEWVVFKSMINMDTGDFAYLVRNAEAGSRPVQALGNREIFINDVENVSGVMPNDNKFYLKLRPTGNTQVKKLDTKKVNLKLPVDESKDEAKNPTTVLGKGKKTITEFVGANGIMGTFEIVFAGLLIFGGLYYGYSLGNSSPFKAMFAQDFAVWVRDTFGWIYNWTVGIFVWLFSFLIPRKFQDKNVSVPQ